MTEIEEITIVKRKKCIRKDKVISVYVDEPVELRIAEKNRL